MLYKIKAYFIRKNHLSKVPSIQEMLKFKELSDSNPMKQLAQPHPSAVFFKLVSEPAKNK